jgi:hypothetical protein
VSLPKARARRATMAALPVTVTQAAPLPIIVITAQLRVTAAGPVLPEDKNFGVI